MSARGRPEHPDPAAPGPVHAAHGGRSGIGLRTTATAFAATAIGLSLFQLFTAYWTLGAYWQRGVHLSAVLVLAFLLHPPVKGRKRGPIGWIVDLALMGGAVYAGWYLLHDLESFANRVGFARPGDVVAGLILTGVLLEASRRVIGVTITIIAGLFLVYAMAGPRGALAGLGELLPGILSHRGYDVDRIVSQLYMGLEGIYGLPLGVAATVVFIFVLFGAFLEVTGAGRFFIDLAYAAAGRQRGGPAKAAVVASGFMGSISGSAIANVVTSGAFTIPLMKRLGYKPEEAGGIEAAASTGGQIMPPIMGAGAFLIAEYTRLPYLEIVKVSVLPAILYFATVYLFVDIIAAKRGMRGLSEAELPRVRAVLASGWIYLLPLVLLVFLLLRNYSPNRVGFFAIASIVVVAAIKTALDRALSRPASADAPSPSGEAVPDGVGLLVEAPSARAVGARALRLVGAALVTGARNAVPVTVACAVAGVVVAVIGLTGVGLKFSALMISFSGGNLLLALVLLILASLVLGMGLPVTASYIVLAVLAAPALQSEFGVPLLIAHLVIFWYSQDSNVTPPVALAAFAGAGIAGSDPMRTGVEAWKFAKGLYLIPLFMVYNPELILGGAWWQVAWNALTALAALGAFAAALEGWLFTRMSWISRLLAAAGMVGIFWPDLRVELAGAALIVLMLAINWTRARRSRGGGEVAGGAS